MKNAKKKQCLKFFALFFKIADWKVLKIAPNVVLDQPVNLAHSDWMHHFAEGQSENSYGVRLHWGERGVGPQVDVVREVVCILRPKFGQIFCRRRHKWKPSKVFQ